jgi:TRAP transporter TAXI family solute receptor
MKTNEEGIMKKLFLILAMFLMFLLLSSPGFAQKIDLKFMTGPMGGSWYPLGGAIGYALQQEIPGLTVSVVPGGGVANVMGVQDGKCELGFSNSCSAVDGVKGRAPFKNKTQNVRQVANLYAQYFQMIVIDNSPIKSVADFKGKILATVPKGNTGNILTEQVLQVYGMSFKDLSKANFVGYNDAVALMKDGHADIYTQGTTIPAASAMDLASARKIRLIALPEDKIKALQQINPGYLKRVVPKGTYSNVDYDVPGIGYFTNLIISAKVPDDLVYKITKALAKNLPRFSQVVKAMKGVTPKDLALDIGVPLHPGAMKYYKEAGVM